MKLYEFTFEDNTNLTESEVLSVLYEDLKVEAELQGWAPGYSILQCAKNEHLPGGIVKYHFEVNGDLLTEVNSGEEKKTSNIPQHGNDMVATP